MFFGVWILKKKFYLTAVPMFFWKMYTIFVGKFTLLFHFSAVPVGFLNIYTFFLKAHAPTFSTFRQFQWHFGVFCAFLSTKCMFYVFVVDTGLFHGVISVPVFFLSTNLVLNFTRLGGPRESGICYNTTVALKLVRWQWTWRACSWHHWITRWQKFSWLPFQHK